MQNELIPRRNNYKKLLSYQKAEVIYLLTFYFCQTYLNSKDRTVDQMVQAARSGKQNIIEGCAASATSSKTEIKLINVAKASLLELLADYEDYLKTRNHRQWEKGSVEYDSMRQLAISHSDPDTFLAIAQTRPPETIANMVIILLYQADYLLFRQLKALEQQFLTEGGFTEKLYHMRKDNRDNPHKPK